MAAERGFWRRLRSLLLWAAGSLLAGSVLAVLVLRVVPPATSMFMLEAYVAAHAAGRADWHADYRWTPYPRISAEAKLAVIASEDQKFAHHPGFDFAAIDAAIAERERGGRVRGASTISQQVAKNLFLWPGQSYLRKGLEAYLTLLIEQLWPKRRILEVYLNVAEFGDGIYGVGAAAPRFFRTDPARLSRAEAARRAAVLPAPRRQHVERPSAYVAAREAWIAGQMAALGGASYLEELDRGI
jgi:monofunctional biosynthetic peptidoglycan transglycosylase